MPNSGSPKPDNTLDQSELDQLLLLNGFLTDEQDEDRKPSLIDEIRNAILDSGKLSLPEWRALRNRLKDIEQLIPTIDLIIELRSQRGDTNGKTSNSDRLRRAR